MQAEEFQIVGGGTEPISAPKSIKERLTTPYMTKYEKARVLGTRALQIRYIYFVDNISN